MFHFRQVWREIVAEEGFNLHEAIEEDLLLVADMTPEEMEAFITIYNQANLEDVSIGTIDDLENFYYSVKTVSPISAPSSTIDPFNDVWVHCYNVETGALNAPMFRELMKEHNYSDEQIAKRESEYRGISQLKARKSIISAPRHDEP